jgi:hypothetical protein
MGGLRDFQQYVAARKLGSPGLSAPPVICGEQRLGGIWRVPGPDLAKEVGGLIRLPFIAVDWTTRRGQ